MNPSFFPADFVERVDRDFLPHVSVDCAVFGFHQGELKILLLKWKHVEGWSLPGGHIRRDESIDEAAGRILLERTGLDRIYLQQFQAFGSLNRGEGVLRTMMTALGVDLPPNHWLAERVISIGYLALVNFAEATPSADAVSEECRWWDVREIPRLIMDHGEIVTRALHHLRTEAEYGPLGDTLLPEKFTMPELQRLHEAVLGHSLDRRNFQKRMLDLGFVERLEERKTGGAHRAPYFYRFRPEVLAGQFD